VNNINNNLFDSNDDFFNINHTSKENTFKNPKDFIIINKDNKYGYQAEEINSPPQFIVMNNNYYNKNDHRETLVIKENISDEVLIKYFNYNLTKKLHVKFIEFFQLLRVAKIFNDNNVTVEIERIFQRKKILSHTNVGVFLLEIILQDNENENKDDLDLKTVYSRCNENSNYILEYIITYINEQKLTDIFDNLVSIFESKIDLITVPKFEFFLFILNKLVHTDTKFKRHFIDIYIKTHHCKNEIKKKFIMVAVLDFTNAYDKLSNESLEFSVFIENSLFNNPETRSSFSDQEESFIHLIYKKANLQCKKFTSTTLQKKGNSPINEKKSFAEKPNVKLPSLETELENDGEKDKEKNPKYNLKFKQEKIISTGGSIQCMAKAEFPEIKSKLIAFGQQDGILKLLEVNREGCEIISSYEGHTKCIKTIIYINEEIPVFITGSIDKTIKIWHIQENYCIDTLCGHSDSVVCLLYIGKSLITNSKDCRILVSGSKDCTIKVWNYLINMCLKTLTGHERSVQCLVDMRALGENIIASGSSDTSIRVWNLKSGTQIKFFNEHELTVQCMIYPFNFNKNLLVSGSLDTSIRIWDVIKGVQDKKLVGHNDFVTSLVSFHEIHVNLMLSGGWDKHFNLWDLETGECLNSFNIGYGVSRGASCMMTYPPSYDVIYNTLVIGNFDGTIKIISIREIVK